MNNSRSSGSADSMGLDDHVDEDKDNSSEGGCG